MKRFILFTAILAALSIVMAGCAEAPAIAASLTPTMEATEPAQTPAEPTATIMATADPKKVYFERLEIDSKAISGNLAGDSAVQQLLVMLPPSYYESDKRFPVVYYVTGFGMSPGSLVPMQSKSLEAAMEKAGQEFIVVEVDGMNQYGGSFLVNSPVSGNWEDYVIDEVVPFIDGKYNTVASALGRGIAGFSMGGFAAINLALRHPDVFCATYGICPGLLEDGGLKEALGSWQGDFGFLRAYGQAFCPMPDVPNELSAIPKLDGSEADAAVVKKWESGFGDLAGKVDAYLALGKPLKAIKIEYGTADGYTWIPKGCVAFSKLLTEKGVGHTLKPFEGGHTVPMTFAKKDIADFFLDAFTD